MEEVTKIVEQRAQLIDLAGSQFMRYGVRSVSMDDISREAGMSKKTLYQYFDNKEDLITAAVEAHIQMEMGEYSDIASTAKNAVEEVFHISRCMRKHLTGINPSLIYDLKKYHREAWEIFLVFKNEFIQGMVFNNIVRGMKEGYYRLEIDPKILSSFRVEQVQMVLDAQIFPPDQFSIVDVQLQLFDHFVHGLLSKEGKNLYDDYIKIP